ncbi:Chromatin accessibility complex protein 1 [Fasciola gigantica]|uniref:Chromatin accessibility complex protein 1 n=2 Tax=Fasciola TaxID=6191 RepID=A0A504YZ17_FASGI|nr:Chromatin accessibility complex protein 1 [Fasciola gigantica]
MSRISNILAPRMKGFLPMDEIPDLRIPPYRTRMMMKSSPEVDCVSGDSAICLSKATELFMQELISAAYREGAKELTYKDLADAQSRTPRFSFLADILPQKITFKEWVEKYQHDFEVSLL